MKALVYTAPEKLEIQDFADPTPAEGEALVRIDSSGICGSDMHAFLGHDARRPAPLILGHEAAGVALSGTREGKQVVLNPLVTCLECPACKRGQENLCPNRQIISMQPREGAFAQMVALPERNILEIPADFPTDKAALCEPIACGWHAVRIAEKTIGPIEATTRCLVIGGGAIGMGAALSIRAKGGASILVSEPNKIRRDYINSLGELIAVDPSDIDEDAEFDLVVDGVGYELTRAFACEKTRPGGVIAHIGLGSATGGVDVRKATLSEITFVGTYTYTMQDFKDTLAAIVDGRLGNLDWIETRPLADGAQSFVDIRANTVSAPKIILKPNLTGE